MTAGCTETLAAAKVLTIRVVENGFVIADRPFEICEARSTWAFESTSALNDWINDWGYAQFPVHDSVVKDIDDDSRMGSDSPDLKGSRDSFGKNGCAAEVVGGDTIFEFHAEMSQFDAFDYLEAMKCELAERSTVLIRDASYASFSFTSFKGFLTFLVRRYPHLLSAGQYLALA